MAHTATDATPSRVAVLGVPVDCLSLSETVDRIEHLMASGRQHQIVTVNPEFLVAARYHRAFRAVLRRASLATADGAGVVLAARLLGRPVRGRVTGADLLPLLAERCALRGWGVFFLGAAPGVAALAAAALQQHAPGLRVAGVWSGSPVLADEPAILEHLRLARPEVLLVAYGAPQQDLWIARNLTRTSVQVAMGVGGAFDFLAGRKPRAPRLLRQAGLEWIYRLWLEPWRYKRMLALPAFVILLARDLLAQRVLYRHGGHY
ncbi:MAG: WecB/TagA/CpsF family glycosyltransferase [Chloroflexi bacterium]|nr:WecB/TagA/CpsF family glycosyltransferase [Chloroflexota bacterium]